MIDIAVIIPTLKLTDLLDQCLTSLSKSTLNGTFEVSVSLNSEPPPEFKNWEKKYSWVKWHVLGKNLGFAKAINYAIQRTTARHYFLLNEDTEVYPDTLQKVINGLERNNVAVVGAKLYYPDRRTLQHCGGILQANYLSNHIGEGELDEGQYDEIRECDYVTGAALGINGDYLKKYGALSTSYFPLYYEETEYCLRARDRDYRVIYDPAIKVVHYESRCYGRFSSYYYHLFHKNRGIFILRNAGLKELLRFIVAEIKWLGQYRPSNQYRTLGRMYLYMLLTFPYHMLTRWK